MSDLFNNRENITSSEFKVMLDTTNEMAQEARAFCKKLWEKFEPYADKHFSKEIKSDEKFQDRFWEMHLGNVLLEKGFNISSENEGPDFKIDLNGQIIWIEATTASNGQKDKPDSLVSLKIGESKFISDEKIALRLTSVIDEKSKKIKEYLEKNTINENEPIIIAINTAKIDVILAHEFIDYANMIFFAKSINSFLKKENGEFVSLKKDFITKHKGSPVSSNIFLDNTHQYISAVLFSKCSYSQYNNQELNNDYLLVCNPFAKNKLPKEIFTIAKKVLFHESDDLIKLFKKDEK